MRCIVDGVSHRGEGVGRIEGKATFIPYAIPGETVEIEIVEQNKSYLRAKLLEVITPSEARVIPDCPHYYSCGGCAYQHMTYAKQLELKRGILQDTLQRIGKINAEVKPMLGMEDPWRYRNKVVWHLQNTGDEVAMGYYMNDSHDLLDIDTCKLISQPMEDLSLYLKDRVTTVKARQDGSITIRESSLDGSLMAILDGLRTIPMELIESFPKLKSLYKMNGKQLSLGWGKAGFEDQVNNIRCYLSPLSFFQVNPAQTQVLYELVRDYCKPQPKDRLLDAFCGTGSIGLYLSSYVKKVTGVENYSPAVANARENAARNNINNCEFIAGACETVIPQLKQKFDLVVLDPPRAGCEEELIRSIIRIAPRCIVYVSCNPSTLARDLAIFTSSGYEVDEVQPIDMFPQTHHVECVVRLYKKAKADKNAVYE